MPVCRIRTVGGIISLSVNTTGLTGVDLLGKSVGDLQQNVNIGLNTISGTLKYVEGYTGFSGAAEEQEGNYLVLHVGSTVEDVTFTVELVGGTHGAVELDEDGIIILKIANTNQKVKITATKDGYTTSTKTYFLTGLTLEEKE